jgi:hypothetical protein
MKAKVTIICILLMTIAMSVSAADADIPFVDIAKAQDEIAVLNAETDVLNSETAELTLENRGLEADIEGWQQKVFVLIPLLAKVKAKSGDLYETNSQIIDPGMKLRGLEALDRNKALATELEDKQDELEGLLADAEKRIRISSSLITTNNRKALRNKDRVTLLEASIAKTETQNALMMDYIESVETFQAEAQDLLDAEL